MNVNKRSKTKYYKQQDKQKIESTDEVTMVNDAKVDVENGNSPQHSNDVRISGHSTPIRQRECSFNVEHSPELDYRCSPIFLPCTQEGNEIAWDWQTSTSKNSTETATNKNCNLGTPKRTKLFQKKRNSNSPLLHQPLKRKQVKMENIENMGKLAAELKALTERMKTMQQREELNSDKKDDNRNCRGTQLFVELNTKDDSNVMLEIITDEVKPNTETVVDKSNKKGSSYEELFDDSIDDSMVKCSQEIEEKFFLEKGKANDVSKLSIVDEEKEFSLVVEKECLLSSSNSVDNSKNSSTSKTFSTISMNSCLKTYSKNSSKTSSASSIYSTKAKDTSLQKSHINNNIISLQEKNKSELFEIPDDSFDDCLATCIEEKVVAKTSEYDYTFSDQDMDFSYGKMSKQTNSTMLNNKKLSSRVTSKEATSTYNVKSSNYVSSKMSSLKKNQKQRNEASPDTAATSANNSLENRKFFKTKSLSANSVNTFVSTTFPLVKNPNSCQNSNISTINDAGNAHPPNRFEEKEDGNCIKKYKSTSILYVAKERTKESQTVRCTPEEIERKRLEAKMRLEAKRKLQQNVKEGSTQSVVPAKRPVKR